MRRVLRLDSTDETIETPGSKKYIIADRGSITEIHLITPKRIKFYAVDSGKTIMLPNQKNVKLK